MVNEFLRTPNPKYPFMDGKADAQRYNEAGLYDEWHISRIQAIEATPEFKEAQAKYFKRQVAGRLAAAKAIANKQARILPVLSASNGLTCVEIAEAVGLNWSEAHNHLDHLLSEGKVTLSEEARDGSRVWQAVREAANIRDVESNEPKESNND